MRWKSSTGRPRRQRRSLCHVTRCTPHTTRHTTQRQNNNDDDGRHGHSLPEVEPAVVRHEGPTEPDGGHTHCLQRLDRALVHWQPLEPAAPRIQAFAHPLVREGGSTFPHGSSRPQGRQGAEQLKGDQGTAWDRWPSAGTAAGGTGPHSPGCRKTKSMRALPGASSPTTNCPPQLVHTCPARLEGSGEHVPFNTFCEWPVNSGSFASPRVAAGPHGCVRVVKLTKSSKPPPLLLVCITATVQ